MKTLIGTQWHIIPFLQQTTMFIGLIPIKVKLLQRKQPFLIRLAICNIQQTATFTMCHNGFTIYLIYYRTDNRFVYDNIMKQYSLYVFPLLICPEALLKYQYLERKKIPLFCCTSDICSLTETRVPRRLCLLQVNPSCFRVV